jgi:hypothetical protein
MLIICSWPTEAATIELKNQADPLVQLHSGNPSTDPSIAGKPGEVSAHRVEQAKTLAEKVIRSDTEEGKYAAILEVLKSLNVGIYTPDGHAIAVGAERGPNDFYLYDFEGRMLATNLMRDDRWTIDDLTTLLSSIGLVPEGAKLSAEDFAVILQQATQLALQQPNDPFSLILLLVRELGLSHSYDTASAMTIPETRLDALQRWLILAEILLPLIREEDVMTSPPPAVGHNDAAKYLRFISLSECDSFGQVNKEGAWTAGKWLVTLIIDHLGLKKAATFLKKAMLWIDGLHGSLLAFSVEVRPLDDVLRTHYGHEEDGKELRFRVFVNMRDELPEILVRCGWISSVEFPKKGPIKDVMVTWQLRDNFNQHGTFNCDPLICITKTNDQGIATLVFHPKKEISPPLGLQREESGTLDGIAWYQAKHKNILGTFAQIFFPKFNDIRWFVEFHSDTLALEYDSVIKGPFSTVSHARGEVRLTWDAAKRVYVGTGEGQFDTDTKPPHKREGLNCTLVQQGQGKTMIRVARLEMTESQDKVLLYYNADADGDRATQTCEDGTQVVDGAHWRGSHHLLRSIPEPTFDFDKDGYPVGDWTFAGGKEGIVAHKSETRSQFEGEFSTSETVRWILRIVPNQTTEK